MTLLERVMQNAELARSTQGTDGAMAAGHNGPYFDRETPVRNTAHWLFTFCTMYEITGERKWKGAAYKACDYLGSGNARPMDAAFWARTNPQKDFCNGLIGQAWAMEGLLKAASTFNREDCYKTAEAVFLLHPFEEEKAIWRRVNVDGSYASIDVTFNHQLWFAAIASQLKDAATAHERTGRFFEQVASRVDLYENGVVNHISPVEFEQRNWAISPLRLLRRFREDRTREALKRNLWLKSLGYHAFNLYAFAMLKESFPEHGFWRSPKWGRMLAALHDQGFRDELEKSPYGYPYNPPGFEAAYTLQVFGGAASDIQWWLGEQVRNNYDPSTGLVLGKNVSDPETSRARLYEAMRIQPETLAAHGV